MQPVQSDKFIHLFLIPVALIMLGLAGLLMLEPGSGHDNPLINLVAEDIWTVFRWPLMLLVCTGLGLLIRRLHQAHQRQIILWSAPRIQTGD